MLFCQGCEALVLVERSREESRWLQKIGGREFQSHFSAFFGETWPCVPHVIPQTANRQLKTVVRLAEFSEIPLLSLSLSRTDTHTHMHMHTPPCTCVTLRWVSKAHPPSPPSSLWVYLAVSARCPLQYVPNVWTPFGENGACPSGWLGEGLMMKR